MSSVLFSDQHNNLLYTGPVSMRKSFDGLSGIVRNEPGREVNAKDVFIFLNKDLKHKKVLLYQAKAYTLFYQRLHKGRFTLPAATASNGSIQLTATDLLSMLHGLNWHLHKKSHSYPQKTDAFLKIKKQGRFINKKEAWLWANCT